MSLDNQAAKTAAYATLHDLEIVATFTDDTSAKSLNRPGLRAALAALEAEEADGLLVYDLSRLTRSVRDWGSLLADYFGPGQHELLSVHDHVDTRSAAGRLALNILLSVCQWQREYIGERTRDALSHVRQTKRLGRAPKLAHVAADVRRHLDDGYTQREVAAILGISQGSVRRYA